MKRPLYKKICYLLLFIEYLLLLYLYLYLFTDLMNASQSKMPFHIFPKVNIFLFIPVYPEYSVDHLSYLKCFNIPLKFVNTWRERSEMVPRSLAFSVNNPLSTKSVIHFPF